ncbi:RNA-binding S4 domain-containing protein [Janibacter sp. DB-40]|uniref:RNA-binding S4 domain-containing protein n=1 Tax=Janibacter sp. DB-40 TaxID=3028808 RepID=UPI002405F616|nr:RNA-binding S4 domain-containing protein [Janibacter sp. DB-40]
MTSAEPVHIRDESIRLGQLLKLAGLVEDGAMARAVIANGEVTVDGQVETRRGAQVGAGSVVAHGGQEIEVVTGEPEVDVPW